MFSIYLFWVLIVGLAVEGEACTHNSECTLDCVNGRCQPSVDKREAPFNRGGPFICNEDAECKGGDKCVNGECEIHIPANSQKLLIRPTGYREPCKGSNGKITFCLPPQHCNQGKGVCA
ncbi:unnamed protein product, partial [Mesorhabditis spiculigera]